MENRASTFKNAAQNLVHSYRQLFEIDTPSGAMPAFQRNQFLAQAFDKHLEVALFFADEQAPMVGRFTHRFKDGRLLFQASKKNVYRVVVAAQVRYLSRV